MTLVGSVAFKRQTQANELRFLRWNRLKTTYMIFSFTITFNLVIAFPIPFHFAQGKRANSVILATCSMSLLDKDHHHKENKAMSFLRKIGKVGGAANKSFINAIGVDEGSVGKSSVVQGDSLSQVRSN